MKKIINGKVCHVHNHTPKMYVRFAQKKPVIFPGSFTVFPGSIYGRFQDKNGVTVFWVCENCKNFKSNKGFEVLFSDGKTGWNVTHVKKGTQIHTWILAAIEKLGFAPAVNKESVDYNALMKAYYLRKKGTGSRINTHQINNPLQWREVTEDAHWAFSGNASVVANAIRY